MTSADHIRMKAIIAILKEVEIDYKGQTIDNIIRQMESRIRNDIEKEV